MTDASKSEPMSIHEAIIENVKMSLGEHYDSLRPVSFIVKDLVSDLATLTRQRDGLKEMLEEVLPEVTCMCAPAYKDRGMHEPNSLCHLEAPIKAALEAARLTETKRPATTGEMMGEK